MRRILFGGLGLALGAFTPAAIAQQPTPATQPPARAAKLGIPSAIPDSPADPDVTQAGLLRPGPGRPATALPQGRFAPPVPVGIQPPGGIPSPMPMSGGMPMPTPSPLPSPRPMTEEPPKVSELRDPTGRIPTGNYIPSVAPEGFFLNDSCLEDPLFCPREGIERLRGCGRTWVTAEMLLWWNRGTQVPALVTTSSPQFNGIPGQGDTQVLLGGSFGNTFHAGARVGGGRWFDDNDCRGFDWRLFWVSPSTATYSASVPPYPLLARPFVNVNPTITFPNVGFGQTAEVVAGPGVATGTISASMMSTVWGAEANYRRFLRGNENARLDGLIGYRYLDIREELMITETFNRLPGSDMTIGSPAMSGVISDRFRTENQFHGGQIGLAGTMQRGRWSLDARASIAFGTVFQSAEIIGAQTLTYANGMTEVQQGGLLAVPGANIGRWSQERFAVVPEVGVNVGYQVTSRMKVFVGYNFLSLSSSVRPGDTIDPNIDAARVPNLLPPGTGTPIADRPMPQMSTSGYFVQGIGFGLIYRW